MRLVIHLRTLSGGEPHPAAQCPTFSYSQRGARAYTPFSVSIMSSRLAVFGIHLVIWDWRSAQTLFVRQSLLYPANELSAHQGAEIGVLLQGGVYR